MKRRTFIYALFTCFIVVNIVLFVDYRVSKPLEKIRLESEKAIDLLKIEKESLMEHRVAELKNNGLPVNLSDTVYAANGIGHSLKEIVGSRKLILRFSEFDCHTCVDKQIKLLLSSSKIIGTDNIILLTTYQNNEYMKRFKRMSHIKFEIYNMGDNLNQEIPDMGIPYFVILDSLTARLQNVFITSRNNENLTLTYFEHIKDLYYK